MLFKYLPVVLSLGPVLQVAARPAAQCPAEQQMGAVYLITNQEENAVVAIPIGPDGMLSQGTKTPTGGAGGVSLDAATGEPVNTDPLVSQSAVTVAGNNVFAVNAGSNTVTMFKIDPKDSTRLTMVGQPVQVPGEFPNTVAASAKNNVVCVGTTGAVAGISCANFSKRGGIGAMDELRVIDLGQTTPPAGPTNTLSQVFFSDDQSTLFATVKGDPAVNNTGFLGSFDVAGCGKKGVVAQEGARSSPEGTAVLFGSTALPGSTDIFVTDASFGAAVLSIDSEGAGTVKGQSAIDGQAATCWATFSAATGTAFVTDVAVNRLVEMSIEDGSIIGEIDLSANGNPGMIDLRAVGDFIYALSPGTGETEAAISVIDAASKEEVQFFQMGAMGVNNLAMGMAARTA